MCHGIHMWKSEDNLWSRFSPSIFMWVSGTQLRSVGFVQQALSWLGNLIDPFRRFVFLVLFFGLRQSLPV